MKNYSVIVCSLLLLLVCSCVTPNRTYSNKLFASHQKSKVEPKPLLIDTTKVLMIQNSEPFLIANEKASLEINMSVFKKNEASQQHFIKRKIQTLLKKPTQTLSTFLVKNKNLEKGSDKKGKTALKSLSIIGFTIALTSLALLILSIVFIAGIDNMFIALILAFVAVFLAIISLILSVVAIRRMTWVDKTDKKSNQKIIIMAIIGLALSGLMIFFGLIFALISGSLY